MRDSQSVNETFAVIIEQYVNHTEARLPGMGAKWVAVGTTSDEALNPLLRRMQTDPPPTAAFGVPMAVSLLTIAPETSGLRPPMLVYAPEGVQALFTGRLDPVEPPPADAVWLKPGEPVPDSPVGTVFVQARRFPPSRTDRVIIRSHHGGHQLLHHQGGGVMACPAAHSLHSRIYRTSAWFPVPDASTSREPMPQNRLAMVVEQYRDHTEAYLPGMGTAWHTTDVTPDGAVEYLTQLIRRYHPVIASRTSPIAVSLVTVRPSAVDLHPAWVERAPAGTMVLFLGTIVPPEPPPADAVQLAPGDPVPEDPPYGRQFLVPPSAEGLDAQGHGPREAVVIHLPPGTTHQVLWHAGPAVIRHPARLVRVIEGNWVKVQHEEHPIL